MPCPSDKAIASKVEEIQQLLASTSPDTSSHPEFSAVSSPNFAQTIDHTLLKPEATPKQIDELCCEAIKYKFKSCCVNSVYASRVHTRLLGSHVLTCVVVGFPLGAMSTAAKAFETAQAVRDGAHEIDMVIPVGLLKAGQYAAVYADIEAVVAAAGEKVPVKVIIETVLLADYDKIAACYLAAEAGARFVKTSTGFSGGGATVEDIRLMKETVRYKGDVLVKASGGVRTGEKCLEMLHAGADRIGTSSGVGIMKDVQPEGEGY